MALQKLTVSNFDEIVYENDSPCLVAFSRKSCHVCKEVIPMLEEMQPKYEGKLGFYSVDVEEDAGLFQRFSLKGVPQLLFFNNGEFQGKMAGKVEEEQVQEKIFSILESGL